MHHINVANLVEDLANDGLFRRSSRLWTGSFAFFDGTTHLRFEVKAGHLVDTTVANGLPSAEIVFSGSPEGWAEVFAETPRPYYQDLVGGAVGRHGFAITGDTLSMAAYYPAIQRAAVLAGRYFREEG